METIIDRINSIIQDFGSFTIGEVEADCSPFLNTKGKLSHLAEEFKVDMSTIHVYDPTSSSSDSIDEYEAFYEEFELSQLEYILMLAEKWAEINQI